MIAYKKLRRNMKIPTLVIASALIFISINQVNSIEVRASDDETCDQARILLEIIGIQVNFALQPHWPQILKVHDQSKVDATETVRLGLIYLNDETKGYYERLDYLKKGSPKNSTCHRGKRQQMDLFVEVLSGELRDCVRFYKRQTEILSKLTTEILKYVTLGDTYDFDKYSQEPDFCRPAIEQLKTHLGELPKMLQIYISELKRIAGSLKRSYDACGRDRNKFIEMECNDIIDLVEECLVEEAQAVSSRKRSGVVY